MATPKKTPTVKTPTSTAKSKNYLTIQDRMVAIKKHEDGLSCRAISKLMGCGKSQIQKIVAEKDAIRASWDSGTVNADRRFVKARKCLYQDVNDKVYDWFCDQRAKNFPISGTLIIQKANIVALEVGQPDFEGSNGWLDGWRKRHNIKCVALSGEAAGVDPQTVDDWSSRLPSITEGYELRDIFNADETGLYWRTLPNRSLVGKDEDRKGIKVCKDRITVMLACSATGEKLMPLVIGRSQNPRCFKSASQYELGIKWRFNDKAWMTSSIFKEWCESINNMMLLKRRTILLFIDNCAAHPPLDLSNIKVWP